MAIFYDVVLIRNEMFWKVDMFYIYMGLRG